MEAEGTVEESFSYPFDYGSLFVEVLVIGPRIRMELAADLHSISWKAFSLTMEVITEQTRAQGIFR